MKTFKTLEEIQPYYNANTNTYEFVENGNWMDVKFEFNLNVNSNIKAFNINAFNINAWDIKAYDINARDINARDIKAFNINAFNINARDINARDIKAFNINAFNINAFNINARDIDAFNINAFNINYYAVCFAYSSFKCHSVQGRRENSRHFCLDREIEYKEDKQ